MKIGIDVSQIIYRTGVSHYRENLIKKLLKIDKNNEYILYGGSLRRFKELSSKIDELGKNSKKYVFPIPPTLASVLWNNFHFLPIEKLIGQVDVVHTSDWAEPPSNAFKVTTIHDLIALKFPRLTPKVIVEAHKARLAWVAKESKRIIAPSQSTKNDLIELGFDPEIIRVIYEAPNLHRKSDQEILSTKRKYNIFGNYLIVIGTNQRKNIERIINAYHLSKFGKDLKLVICGERKGLSIKEERGVIFVGNIPDDDLSAMLSGSSALIFASLYEGLGVPILDAFNCNVPVVASNVSSIPEIASDAAVMVDPYDVNSIAEGIEKAISSPKSLIAKGAKKVKEFSWEKTARMTLDVYNEVKL